MKKVEAIIKPFTLGEVKEALSTAGIIGMTVSEVRGVGRQTVARRGTASVRTRPASSQRSRSRLSFPDHGADRGVALMCDTAKTGSVGDGKVSVWALEDAVRIRTGEHGDRAV